jgi:hypothetical protein
MMLWTANRDEPTFTGKLPWTWATAIRNIPKPKSKNRFCNWMKSLKSLKGFVKLDI